MKEFTEADVQDNWIQADRSDLIDAPMWWHKQGLSQTASGYGKKLNSGMKIRFCGKDYRVYVTCFSNAGTAWFVTKGRRIVVG